MIDSLLRERRSIRKYQQKPLSDDLVAMLQEVALRSPSSRGIHPWEFVFVTDNALLAALARCKPHGASFLKQAALGIVVCADTHKSDVWIEDCAIASALLHLAAHSAGLGSCWIQVRQRQYDDATTSEAYIRQTLSLPDYMAVDAILSIGYPDEIKPGHPVSTLEDGKIHLNSYCSA